MDGSQENRAQRLANSLCAQNLHRRDFIGTLAAALPLAAGLYAETRDGVIYRNFGSCMRVA